MLKYISLFAAFLLPAGTASADVRLPEVIGDHMVLQQNSEIALWGWACAGEIVEIEASWGAKCQVRANDNGQWRTKIQTPAAPPLDKGLHPENITFTAQPNENMAQIKDVLIGEVWLCSGQSNMAMLLRPGYPAGWCAWYGEAYWPEESKHAERPGLRVFNVENTQALTPQTDCKGVSPSHVMLPKDPTGLTPCVRRGWQSSTADTVPDFSAVPYYFGSRLQEKLNVPVGLITSHVGGTGIESWVSPEVRSVPPAVRNERSAPHVCFNGMIAPLASMTIRGVIWYQGESDVGMGSRYAPLFQSFIADWRKQFNSEDMPFYFVQIAPCNHGGGTLAAELREAQASALELKNTGMAVISDVGDPDNIHPKNKRDVGWRLASQALNKTYGHKEIAADGPVLKSINVANGNIHMVFDNLGGGLVSRDGKPLTCFEVAGPDGKFSPASATIVGDVVVVASLNHAAVNAVRMGWGSADMPNLMSRNGLPARQFMVVAPYKITEVPVKE